MLVTIIGLLSTHRPLAEGIAIRDGGKTVMQYRSLLDKVSQVERAQTLSQVTVVNPQDLTTRLANIQIDIQLGHREYARKEMDGLDHDIDGYLKQINAEAAQMATRVTPASGGQSIGHDVPILLYHYPPADFEAQMTHLQQAGYHTISLDELAMGMSGNQALPPKPVVITFDDGFANQMSAVGWLVAHQMKATFYIINGGESSHYCIGASRRPGNCGDAYLTWDQIKEIDRNPLLTIGSHTVDHLELAKQSPDVQRFQIFESKRELEARLGHPIHHFCYPYGSFNATTVALVQEAGFTTATTTVPGTFQPPGSLYTLKRVRNASDLK
jgi:peptidoglycan/xylan/chitin deacetylase (PgdA/CDA1 family)